MNIGELVQEKRQEILRIAAKHGVRRVLVFGSVARGEAGSNSDVDFLIEAGPRRTPFFPGGLAAELQELLGREVDVVEPEGIYPPLKEAILKEARPL